MKAKKKARETDRKRTRIASLLFSLRQSRRNRALNSRIKLEEPFLADRPTRRAPLFLAANQPTAISLPARAGLVSP